MADPGDEQSDGGGGYRSETFLETLRLHLHMQLHTVLLLVLLRGHSPSLQPGHELLEDEPILLGDHFPDGLGGELRLALPDHLD